MSSIASKNFEQLLANIKAVLAAHESSFPEYIDNIAQLERDFRVELDRIEAEDQCLSIGIMGQVKAGKSSFLNALLFDGKPILPEAATPKTANLTRIAYGPSPLFTVHYYSPDEWEKIVENADSGSDGSGARVARDLLEMVRVHGIDVQATIARQKDEHAAAGVEELMGRLNDFVGENGKFTALVKYAEIQLPLDDLKGFEIIDTPGMNDPVPSRTQKTKDYMATCDVVFFLSRCSQFLDHSDMDLLTVQLPSKGVKRMVLVAGQLDGVIADDGYDRPSLAETERNVRTRISRRAEAEIERLAAIKENRGDDAELIRSLKIPIFSSTFAHGFARWDEGRWGKSMRHIHGQLVEMAETQWGGYRFTQEDWERLGNFPALEQAYQLARQDKHQLLQARYDDLLPRNQAQLGSYLDELGRVAAERIVVLKTGDVHTIEQGAQACQAKISGIANRLAETIDAAIRQTRETVSAIKGELREEIAAAASVQTQTGQRKEVSSRTVSTSTWYLPWTWGDEETIDETYYVNYEYIAVADVIERLTTYARESSAGLTRSFNAAVSMSALRADLKRNLVDELVGDAQFDPSAFRNTLESVLSHLKLPDLEIDLGDCGQLISAQFSGKTVKNEQKMAALRDRLREALSIVFRQLSDAADEASGDLIANLEHTRDSLAQQLSANVQAELQRLKKDLANKAEEIEKYEALVKICSANSGVATP